MSIDDIIETRIRYADTGNRKGYRRTDIESLRTDIGAYITSTLIRLRAQDPEVSLADVPCPPLAEWGVPPLPSPTRLRLFSRGHTSQEECVQAEFERVRKTLADCVLPQPRTAEGQAEVS